MLNRAYFGWIRSYHLCINLVCISVRLCVISGFDYVSFFLHCFLVCLYLDYYLPI